MQHPNARLTPRGRRELVQLVERGATLRRAAEACNVALSTAHRWVVRWRAASSSDRASGACLRDRSSRPHRSPRRVDAATEQRVVGTLVSLSDDEDGDVRDWALFSLARQYDVDTPSLRDLFVRHLADPDDDARDEAIVGLARRRDQRALPALLTALRPETATETTIEAAAHLGDERSLPSLEELARSGWDGNSGLAGAIRNCDPGLRARWEAIGTALAATLSAELEAHLGGTAFVVEVGRPPLEWFSRLAGTWTRANGTDAKLFYELDALVDERLDGDLEGAAHVFRHDILEPEA
jgi:HEAT repeat protein